MIHDTHLLASIDGIDLSDAVKQRGRVAGLTNVANSAAGQLISAWRDKVVVDDEHVSLTIDLAPAIVLRNRGTGSALRFYDAMLAALREPGTEVPIGLSQLVLSLIHI